MRTFEYGLRSWEILKVNPNKSLIRCTTYKQYNRSFWITNEELYNLIYLPSRETPNF
jgi:hypothetical protein